jgi:transposase
VRAEGSCAGFCGCDGFRRAGFFQACCDGTAAGIGGYRVAFFYSADRAGTHPEQHLADYAGLMQADAYAGFDKLYAAGRKPSPIIEAACWAHARRKFFDLARLKKAPIAIEAVERIDALFAVEREINGMSPQERVRVRNERSRPLVLDLESWLRQKRAQLSAKNETAKAIQYSLKLWSPLTRFLDDGRLCMSNNAAERALRGIAVGRHNWTFAGSDDGGRRAAAIYTLIETCLCRARHNAVYAGSRTMPNGLVFPGIHSDRGMIGSA